MDEQNCAIEYKSIEGNVSKHNIDVEMVVQEEFVPPSKYYSHQHEIWEHLGHASLGVFASLQCSPLNFFRASTLVADSFPFIRTQLIFILLFSYVFLILQINYSKPNQFSCNFKLLLTQLTCMTNACRAASNWD